MSNDKTSGNSCANMVGHYSSIIKTKTNKQLENDDNRNPQKQKEKKSRWSSSMMMWENRFKKTFMENKEKEHSTICFINHGMQNVTKQ